MDKKAIFITGGASGIGRAVAQLFASRGWFVGIADVDVTGMAATAALLKPAAASTHVLDVRDPDAWRRALAEFSAQTGGRIDAFFNNAGVMHGGPIAASRPADIDRTVDINLKGVLHGAMAVYPYLKATPRAHMISTCSAAGIFASDNMVIYAATKFGVRGMTEALAREWRADGIGVHSIMPGFIDTPLLDGRTAGSNRTAREAVRDAGLEFTPVAQVAEVVWRLAHGGPTHRLVGRTAQRLGLLVRWAPWLLPKGGQRVSPSN